MCIDPNCATNQEPDVVVGQCPTCKAAGKATKLVAQRNPRTLKRFIRCENYEECETSYPLPQYGNLTATEEVCEHCGAPLVIVTTARGPWKLCPNFDCPGKQKDGEDGKAAGRGRSAKKASAPKKSAPKKPAKRSASKKSSANAASESESAE